MTVQLSNLQLQGSYISQIHLKFRWHRTITLKWNLYNIVTERRIDEETHRSDDTDRDHDSKYFKHNSDFLTPSRVILPLSFSRHKIFIFRFLNSIRKTLNRDTMTLYHSNGLCSKDYQYHTHEKYFIKYERVFTI